MSTPTPLSATLIPVTPEAAASINHCREIRITTFPFKVGRESRMRTMDRFKSQVERRLGGVPALNDLYLLEPAGALLHISREHFLISLIGDRFALVDRNSACGTIVSGRTLRGGDTPESMVELHDGDLIVVGAQESPYVFQFRIG